jgi:hypothetical protein
LKTRFVFAAAIAAGLALSAVRASAAPEEIQVYEDDMDKPGQFGLDVHANYVVSGYAPPAYTGEQPSAGRWRLTPEFSYGLTPNIELGAYLPLTTVYRNQFVIDGEKFRIKYIAPKIAGRNWYWGVNFEVGDVDRILDINPWNAELKGIAGWRSGPWDIAFNTNLDWAVAGPQRGPASVQLATKISYKVAPNLALGVESYDGAGDINHLGEFSGAGHSVYATADTSIGLWDLNIGVGHGYSGETDKWIVKMIVGVPIDD